MRKNWLLCILILSAVALLANARVPGPSFRFTSIDFPGAVLTQPQGINPGGEIVGLYKDTAGKQHGFLLSSGQFTSIDYPGRSQRTPGELDPAAKLLAPLRICPAAHPISTDI